MALPDAFRDKLELTAMVAPILISGVVGSLTRSGTKYQKKGRVHGRRH